METKNTHFEGRERAKLGGLRGLETENQHDCKQAAILLIDWKKRGRLTPGIFLEMKKERFPVHYCRKKLQLQITSESVHLQSRKFTKSIVRVCSSLQ